MLAHPYDPYGISNIMLILSKSLGMASLISVDIMIIMCIQSKNIGVHIPVTHLHHAVIPTSRRHPVHHAHPV